ncbi:MAG TPA: hypothetical protein VLD40_06665 [Dissulfurispiraceae bacterium]|nr:hypothetical protein [Dissulfurispiraceae bacterium]
MSDLIPPFSTTGIGSVPHTHADDACQLILRTFDIPFWPQLPRRSFREAMIAQYSEGMPYVNVRDEDGSVWVSRDLSDELERFYESCGENSRIAISEDHAFGLHTFLRLIKGRRFPILKGHVTGPVTFTLGLKDRDGKLVYFDEELREISSMLLQAKARWQADILRQHAERVIVFIDEPILSAVGSSSYLGVDSAELLRLLRGVVSAVESAGGISGIHCCGRADWPLVMQSGAKILSFDAYEYFQTLALYPEEIREFLQAGGYLAWGIVPTSESIRDVDDERLKTVLSAAFDTLSTHVEAGMLRSRSLLTPSCGTASRSIEETIKVFQLLVRLKEEML